MKSQISRNTYRPDRHFSGVYQQQGRMVLDSDGNEQVEITRERLNQAMGDVIGSGIPRKGGLDIITDGAGGFLIAPGRIYVDGIPAEVTPSDEQVNIPYHGQEDFPGAPAIILGPESPPTSPPSIERYKVYADIWERLVAAIEDHQLLDSGLHGADTCTRTQTMVQIKWCGSNANPEDRTQNPQRGSAKLSLEMRASSTSPDKCDPCSQEISLASDTGNYLFRVEVHDVVMDPSGLTMLTLKWSSENGAEQFQVDNIPSDFTSGNWVYEFFGEKDEKHLGKHLVEADGFPSRGKLDTNFSYPTNPTKHPNVRRWDGYCTLVKSGSNWALAKSGNKVLGMDRGIELAQTSDPVSRLGDTFIDQNLIINLSSIQLKLTLWEDSFESVFLAGDFWQAAVREKEALTSPPKLLLDAEEPHGIVHHYLLLAEIEGNNVSHPEGLCQRFAFPPLTDIRASEICTDNLCPQLDAEGVTTVQDALVALCNRGGEGGGCVDSVGEGGTYPTLNEAIDGLVGQKAINLCLLPGKHHLEQPLASVPDSIKFSGSGRAATELVVPQDYELVSTSIIFRDLTLTVEANQRIRLRAPRVEIRSCTVQRAAGRKGVGPIMNVSSVKRGLLSWIDNDVIATWSETNFQLLKTVHMPGNLAFINNLKFRQALSDLLTLDPGVMGFEYAQHLDAVTEEIANLTKKQRKQWVAETPTSVIRELPKTPTTHLEADLSSLVDSRSLMVAPGSMKIVAVPAGAQAAAKAFYDMLNRPELSKREIQSALDLSLRSMISTGFETGLGTGALNVGGSIQDSIFHCEVMLNADAPEGVEPKGAHVFQNFELPIDGQASMRMAGNHFNRVVTLLPSSAFDPQGNLVGPVIGFESLFLGENSFYGNLSSFSSTTTTMQGNHFSGTSGKLVAALAINQFGVFSGNWAPVNKARIITTASEDFRAESGNLLLEIE